MNRATTQQPFAGFFPLTTLEPEQSTQDLEPLAQIVGSARVVALGESAHYAHEFYLLRHLLLRFLIDRLGFGAVAMESGVPEGFIANRWIQGGPGNVADIQARAITWSMGLCDEMRSLLTWLRARHEASAAPVHFYGIDLPGSTASMTPALDPLKTYLEDVDSSFLPRFEKMHALALDYANVNVNDSRAAYAAMPQSDRNELTALLSDTEARLESMRLAYVTSAGEEAYETARRCLRSAVRLDSFLRQDIAAAAGDSTLAHANIRDAAMADAMDWILQREERVVLLAHNIHIARTPVSRPARDLPRNASPLGQHLASRLGDKYVPVATTFGGGVVMGGDVHREGTNARIRVWPRDAPPPSATTVDDLMASWGIGPHIVDLRALDASTARAVDGRPDMRSTDGEVQVLAREAYDALAFVPHLSLWHSSSTPALPHVDNETPDQREGRRSE